MLFSPPADKIKLRVTAPFSAAVEMKWGSKMEITLEQVEKLREKTGASYNQCRDALEAANGDLLEALLALEKQGNAAASPGGFYSTQAGFSAAAAASSTADSSSAHAAGPAPEEERASGKDWRRSLRSVLNSFLALFRHASANRLEVWRKGQLFTSLPVAVLLILAVVAFYITFPLLLLGLILGYQYRFTGPDVGREAVNDVAENLSDLATDLVGQTKAAIKKYSQKKGGH